MDKIIVMSVLAGLLACGASGNGGNNGTMPPGPTPSEPTPPDSGGGAEEPAQRPQMTVEECEAVGVVVGDIGDGAVHRPDYRCPDGQPPIGTVPLGIEGSVCCAR